MIHHDPLSYSYSDLLRFDAAVQSSARFCRLSRGRKANGPDFQLFGISEVLNLFRRVWRPEARHFLSGIKRRLMSEGSNPSSAILTFVAQGCFTARHDRSSAVVPAGIRAFFSGIEQSAARQSHKLEVAGSSPAPAPIFDRTAALPGGMHGSRCVRSSLMTPARCFFSQCALFGRASFLCLMVPDVTSAGLFLYFSFFGQLEQCRRLSF
jgi:hypothetical protein